MLDKTLSLKHTHAVLRSMKQSFFRVFAAATTTTNGLLDNTTQQDIERRYHHYHHHFSALMSYPIPHFITNKSQQFVLLSLSKIHFETFRMI